MLTIMILTILVFGLQLVVSHYTEEGDIPSKNSYKRNMTISIISAIVCTILAILFGKNIYDKWIEGESSILLIAIYIVFIIGSTIHFIHSFRKIKNQSL